MRYDLISPRPRKDGKTHWQKVGAAFPRDKGGFSLVFDALPSFPPTPAEREELRKACAEDLRNLPVWIAANGAAMQTTPQEKRDEKT